jgi:hypothetical protein
MRDEIENVYTHLESTGDYGHKATKSGKTIVRCVDMPQIYRYRITNMDSCGNCKYWESILFHHKGGVCMSRHLMDTLPVTFPSSTGQPHIPVQQPVNSHSRHLDDSRDFRLETDYQESKNILLRGLQGHNGENHREITEVSQW